MSAAAELALARVTAELARICALPTVDRDEPSPDRFSVGARWVCRLVQAAIDGTDPDEHLRQAAEPCAPTGLYAVPAVPDFVAPEEFL